MVAYPLDFHCSFFRKLLSRGSNGRFNICLGENTAVGFLSADYASLLPSKWEAGVFHVLLRKSPLDDIPNEPLRKPPSSLEGPPGGGTWSDVSRVRFPLDPAPLFDGEREEAGWPARVGGSA